MRHWPGGLMVLALAGCACPEDRKIFYDGRSQAELCRENGRRVIAYFDTADAATIDALVAPIGRVVCEEETLAQGCIIVELADGCCQAGMEDLFALDEVAIFPEMVDPANSCGCLVGWTLD